MGYNVSKGSLRVLNLSHTRYGPRATLCLGFKLGMAIYGNVLHEFTLSLMQILGSMFSRSGSNVLENVWNFDLGNVM